MDAGSSSAATLAELANRITMVKRFTVESARDLFLHVGGQRPIPAEFTGIAVGLLLVGARRRLGITVRRC